MSHLGNIWAYAQLPIIKSLSHHFFQVILAWHGLVRAVRDLISSRIGPSNCVLNRMLGSSVFVTVPVRVHADTCVSVIQIIKSSVTPCFVIFHFGTHAFEAAPRAQQQI